MIRRPWLSTAGFAVLWIVAAGITRDVTYHLAPVIVAAAPVISYRQQPLGSAVLGFGLATAIALGLAALGYLTGPSLLPFGGALLESVVGALIGATLGGLLAGRVAAPD
jgi:hypothetical protein